MVGESNRYMFMYIAHINVRCFICSLFCFLYFRPMFKLDRKGKDEQHVVVRNDTKHFKSENLEVTDHYISEIL